MKIKKVIKMITFTGIVFAASLLGYNYYQQMKIDTFIHDKLSKQIKKVRNVPGVIYGDDLPFEFGTITFSEQGWDYIDSTDCIRLAADYDLNLKKGDGLLIDNNQFQYCIGVHTTDNEWKYEDWRQGGQGYIIPYDGQYTVVIKWDSVNESDIPVDCISCMFRIFDNHCEDARTHLFMDDITYTVGHASGGNAGSSPVNVPENSLIGVEYYASQGYWGVECDIRLTADGEWILCHDETLDRTTDQMGYIRDYTLDELMTFHLQKKNVISEYTMPSLDQWLDTCKNCGLVPVIEIEYDANVQETHIKKIVDALAEREMEKDSIIISFDYEPLIWAKKYNRSVATLVVAHEFPDLTYDSINNQRLTNLMVYGNVGLFLNQNNTTNPLTAQHSEDAHSYGLFVGTWTSYPSHRAETIQMLNYNLNLCGAESCPDVRALIQ